jgi:hypothetical protein
VFSPKNKFILQWNVTILMLLLNSMFGSHTILCYMKFFFILVYFMHKFGSIGAMIWAEINKNIAYEFLF